MIEFTNMEVAGFLPTFFNENDPDVAVAQIDKNYQHGGGWRDMEGFTVDFALNSEDAPSLHYPGDEPLKLLSWASLHLVQGFIVGFDEATGKAEVKPVSQGEIIALFECEFVAVINVADQSYRVARID